MPPVHSHSKSPIAETQTVQSVASKETKDFTQGLTKKPNLVVYAAVAVGVLVLMPVVFSLFSGDKNQKTSSYGVSAETKTPAFDGDAARLAEEKAAKEKEFAEQLAAEKLASEKAKAEADAKAATEKLAAERLAADKLASEKAKADADAKAAAKPTVPVATIAQPTPTTKNPNAAIVDSMVKDGMDCFKAKRYDCAISQAKSALRLDPNSASAKSLQQKAKAAQQAAMDSIEIR